MLSGMIEGWSNRVATDAARLRQTRAVLIVCKSERDADQLATRIPQARVYVRSDGLDAPSSLDVGDVLISTNLAGRGTDIAISEALEAAGGLHVCLAYLPDNERIQRQAFGRAARKGQPGSAQIIAWTGHCDRIQFAAEPGVYMNEAVLFGLFESTMTNLEAKRVRSLVESSRGEDIVEECFCRLLELVCTRRNAFRSTSESDEQAAVEAAKDAADRNLHPLAHATTPEMRRERAGEIAREEFLKTNGLAAENFDKFAMSIVMESFSFWKKRHENELHGPNTDAVLNAFKYEFFPQCEELLGYLSTHLNDTSYRDHIGDRVLNPFLLIDKGMRHSSHGHDRSATELFSSAIDLSPQFSAFAYFNRAYTRIRLEEFDEAVRDLDMAEKQIQDVDIAQLCSMSMMISNTSSSGEMRRFTGYVDVQQKVYSALLSNISEARQMLADLRHEGHTPGAVMVASTDGSKMHLRKDLDSNTVSHFHHLGLRGFIKVYCKKEKEKSGWFESLLCGLIGLCQVIGGVLLTAISAGTLARLGYALISEGISDIIYAIEHGIKGDFSWGTWAVKKAVSLAITFLTLGMGGFNGAAAGSSSMQQLGKVVVKELVDRGLSYVLDTVMQEAVRLVVKELVDSIREGLRRVVDRMISNAQDSFDACVEAAAMVGALNQDALASVETMLRDIPKKALAGPSVVSAVSRIAGGVSNCIKRFQPREGIVRDILAVVDALTSAINIASRVREIVDFFSGSCVNLAPFLDRIDGREGLQRRYREHLRDPSLAALIRGSFRFDGDISAQDVVCWLQQNGAVDGAGKVAADFHSRIEQAPTTTATAPDGQLVQVIQIGREASLAADNAKPLFVQVLSLHVKLQGLTTAKDRISTDLRSAWVTFISDQVSAMVFQHLKNAAASEMAKVTASFSDQFHSSSLQASQALRLVQERDRLVGALLGQGSGNFLQRLETVAAYASTASVPRSAGGGGTLIGSLREATDIANAADLLRRGDMAGCLARLADTPLGRSAAEALHARGRGAETASALSALGDLPVHSVQSLARIILSATRLDLSNSLAVLGIGAAGPCADSPEGTVHQLHALSQHLSRGEDEGALLELLRPEVGAALEALDSAAGPFSDAAAHPEVNQARQQLLELRHMAECVRCLECGDASPALDALARTQLGAALASIVPTAGAHYVAVSSRYTAAASRGDEGLSTIQSLVRIASAIQKDRVEIALELSATLRSTDSLGILQPEPLQHELSPQNESVVPLLWTVTRLRCLSRHAEANEWSAAFSALADLLERCSGLPGERECGCSPCCKALSCLARFLSRCLAQLRPGTWPSSAQSATWRECTALADTLRLVRAAASDSACTAGDCCSVEATGVDKETFSAALVQISGCDTAKNRAEVIRSNPAVCVVALPRALADRENEWVSSLIIDGLRLLGSESKSDLTALLKQLQAHRSIGNLLRGGLDIRSAASAVRCELGSACGCGGVFGVLGRRLAPVLEALADHAAAGALVLQRRYYEAAEAARNLGLPDAYDALMCSHAARMVAESLTSFADTNGRHPELRDRWNRVLDAFIALEERIGSTLAPTEQLHGERLSTATLEALAAAVRGGDFELANCGVLLPAQTKAVQIVISAALIEADLNQIRDPEVTAQSLVRVSAADSGQRPNDHPDDDHDSLLRRAIEISAKEAERYNDLELHATLAMSMTTDDNRDDSELRAALAMSMITDDNRDDSELRAALAMSMITDDNRDDLELRAALALSMNTDVLGRPAGAVYRFGSSNGSEAECADERDSRLDVAKRNAAAKEVNLRLAEPQEAEKSELSHISELMSDPALKDVIDMSLNIDHCVAADGLHSCSSNINIDGQASQSVHSGQVQPESDEELRLAIELSLHVDTLAPRAAAKEGALRQGAKPARCQTTESQCGIADSELKEDILAMSPNSQVESDQPMASSQFSRDPEEEFQASLNLAIKLSLDSMAARAVSDGLDSGLEVVRKSNDGKPGSAFVDEYQDNSHCAASSAQHIELLDIDEDLALCIAMALSMDEN